MSHRPHRKQEGGAETETERKRKLSLFLPNCPRVTLLIPPLQPGTVPHYRQPPQFSQAMTPTTQSPSVTDEFEPVLFDILKDAEKLIVVDSNNITPDEMKTTRSVL